MLISRAGKFLVVFFVAWLLAGSYVLYRHFEIERLHQIALSPSSGTAAAESAIRKLGNYGGSWAMDSLVGIATSEREFIDGRQELAIKVIAARGNIEALAQLAELFQPSVGLARRDAVAVALQENVCNEQCTQSVLHYLERYWYVSGREEDITTLSDHFGGHPDSPQIVKEQNFVTDGLAKVLARNGGATLDVLHRVYGLGSAAPSAFSLHVVELLHLRRACPLIAASKRSLLDSSKEERLEGLLSNLQCQLERGDTEQ